MVEIDYKAASNPLTCHYIWRSIMHRLCLVLAILLVLTPMFPHASKAVQEPADTPLAFLDGMSLIVLETDDIPSMHRALNLIHSFGGKIAIMSPPSILLGWVPFEVRDDLIGRAGIKDIYYTEVLPEELGLEDEQSIKMINYFNGVVRGEVQAKYEMHRQAVAARNVKPEMRPDALDPPAFDRDSYIENLKNVGLSPSLLDARGLLLKKSDQTALGNSDKMSGTVSVTVFFVESDGSGSDPDLYTWTDQAMQDYINGVNNGLIFWTTQAQNYGDCWVAFMVHYYPGTDSRCQQWIEPILHASSYQSDWVYNVITQFGYTSGTVFSRVTAFNTWQRSTYGTDWAYSAFVAYNPPPASDRFTDGYAAAAYFGGPYAYLLYRSFSSAVSEVFPHETGHIFHACDEYYQAGYGGCTSCGVCYNGVDNANCEYCGPGKPCMMLGNTFNLCQYTPGHVGWFYSPCAPGPLNPPVALTSSPSGQYQGLDVTIGVGGTDFQYGVYVDLGPDIILNSTNFISQDSFTANLTVLNSATPGWRDIVVYNRDLQSDVLPHAFQVINTTRHYMSPTGGNVYPYMTPSTAATSLADAITVANNGDSLFVESTTLSSISVNINHGVKLYGGWINNFTSRDLAGGKTVLDLNGNVTISSDSNTAVLDGFVVQNGTGTYSVMPYAGYFGGGVRIVNSRATIANCEIKSNSAATGTNLGVGGGIFAVNSTVDINNNYIWGNTADYGAGIGLYNSGGSISNNTISGNVASSFSATPIGAAIHLDHATDVAISGNIIDGNTGAHDGGAIYADHSGVVTISGGIISHGSTSYSGGAVDAKKSSLVLDSVEFSHNSSAIFGGALSLHDTSSVTITDCRFLWNSAIIGGGIYVAGGDCYADHSLYVGNNASNTSGAAYMSDLTGGSFIGNTLDRNTAGSSTGGLMVVNSNITVSNNIVTNSGSYGIYCSGSPSPTFKYNDVWNSGTSDYNGCAPGEGSISADPMFADTAAVDYHLLVHSPAIDAGDTRAAYNDPDGSRGDMGCYGSHALTMAQPSYPKNLAYSVGGGNITLSWSRNPENDMQSYAVYRDTTAGFVPGLANFVQFVPATDTTMTETFVSGAYYKISAVDSSGYGSGYSNEISPVATGVGDKPVVFKFKLYQNVPNPFNPVTTIRYELDARSPVTLIIYDISGRKVKQLVNRVQGAGIHNETWYGANESGEPVASGIYFYRLRAGKREETRKMVLLR